MSNRILNYPEATAITSDDYILLDNADTGAKCIKASALNINMDNYTIKEARGSIASFDDGEDLPLAFMGAYITAIQDLHGYDYPWVGGSGANKWDEEWELGDIDAQGNPTSSTTLIRAKNFNPCEPNTTYKVVIPSGASMYMKYYDNNKNFITPTVSAGSTITTPSNCYYFKFVMGSAYGTAYHNDIAINYPATVTTYSPYSNECPISGWDEGNVSVCGVNVWDEEWVQGYWSRGNYVSASSVCCKDKIPVKPNTSCYIKIPSGNYFYYTFYDNDKNFIDIEGYDTQGRLKIYESGEILIPSNAYYLTWNTSSTYGTTYNNDISINYPSTDTSYHAYNGNTYSLTFTDGSNPLTVYGGYVDLVSGVLTVNRAYKDLGDLTWNKGNMNYANTGRIFYSSIPQSLNMKKNSNIGSCEIFAYNPYSEWPAGQWENQKLNNITTLGSIVACAEDVYQTATDFKTAVTGYKYCYELATPLTYQLSKQQIRSLVGENNIFADTGDSIVDYRKLWVKPEM